MTESGQKSSNEILTELFGAFNAEPPKASLKPVRSKSDDKKRLKKKKKSKKKHKEKKRSREKGDDADSSNIPRKKHKSSKVKVPVEELPKALDNLLDDIETTNGSFGSKDMECKVEPPDVITETNGTHDVTIPPISANIESESLQVAFEEPVKIEKDDKKKGRIQISNLKNSSVFKETLKAIEDKKKEEEEKKASYEEGEISDSSHSDHELDNEGEHVVPDAKTSSRNNHTSRSRSGREKRKRKKSRSRSRSRHGSSHHRSHRHSRHSSKHRHRHRDHLDEYERSKRSSGRERLPLHSRDRRSHSSSKERDKRKSRSVSKSLERIASKDKIDKQKLLAIARKNALKLIDAGIVQGSDKFATIKSGGKTVSELTEYCKKLSKKEADEGDLSDILSDSTEDDDGAFHHPFQVRERPNSIVMNIKNATPLPTRSLQEKAAEQSKHLRLQFPVSSGSSHRLSESVWVPADTKSEAPRAPPPLPPTAPAKKKSLPPLPPPPIPPPSLVEPSLDLSAVPPPLPPAQPVFPVIQPKDVSNIPTPGTPSNLDISAIVSKRLNAMRKLQENPNDRSAITEMSKAQTEMQRWAVRRTEFGEFSGSTGAKVLSAAELNSGVQAWAKKDQLLAARPVKGGMGMTLLQKMGWQPGEGLGKNKEGSLEPLKLEVKTDKKGLVATVEARRLRGKLPIKVGPALPTVKTLDGKHPVSMLIELCSRRKWNQPDFQLAFECGPDHKKNFLFKVTVNGKEYKPNIASINKKQAKAEAAAICLRALGLISPAST